MRALLDTHIALWWLADNPQLSNAHRTLITDPDNELFVSAVSIAEIAIKSSLEKLVAPSGVADTVAVEGFRSLPLSAAHAEALRDLPWHHRDPFDRMLVAQCVVENLPLITADSRLREYGITCL
ncbi:MAG: type II toxin-antitoxin system VapC family toxin [Terrimesophilobacter sp.]